MFIGRKSDGTIYGVWTCKQPEDDDHPGMEELPSDHPEVLEFLKPKIIPKQETVADLKAVLVEKGIITDQDIVATESVEQIK